MTEKTIDKIVEAIESDISDRCGIGDEWQSLHSLAQEEIKDSWRESIRRILENE